jgi:hypothetical protein
MTYIVSGYSPEEDGSDPAVVGAFAVTSSGLSMTTKATATECAQMIPSLQES